MNADFAKALVNIAMELKNPGFDSTNPHYKNRYASLAGARNTIVPIAAKHGVAHLQELTSDAEGVSCETVLVHVSGEERKCGALHLPAAKHDPQGFGSAATYARRYSLLAAFGVVGDDDDDANEGSKAYSERPTQARSAGPTASDVIPLGKHAGKKWSEASTEYLSALLDMPEAPKELKSGAQREIDRRDRARTPA